MGESGRPVAKAATAPGGSPPPWQPATTPRGGAAAASVPRDRRSSWRGAPLGPAIARRSAAALAVEIAAYIVENFRHFCTHLGKARHRPGDARQDHHVDSGQGWDAKCTECLANQPTHTCPCRRISGLLRHRQPQARAAGGLCRTPLGDHLQMSPAAAPAVLQNRFEFALKEDAVAASKAPGRAARQRCWCPSRRRTIQRRTIQRRAFQRLSGQLPTLQRRPGAGWARGCGRGLRQSGCGRIGVERRLGQTHCQRPPVRTQRTRNGHDGCRLVGRDRQTQAALGAATVDHGAAVLGRHTGAVTVGAHSAGGAGITKSFLHDTFLGWGTDRMSAQGAVM